MESIIVQASNGIYYAERYCVNVIEGPGGEIVIPEAINFPCKLQIVINDGEYHIRSGYPMWLGGMESRHVMIRCGSGFETQPMFVWLESKKKWQIVGHGLVQFLDE